MGFFEKIIPGLAGAATSMIPGVGPFLAPVAAGAASSILGGGSSGSSGGGSGGYGGGGGGGMMFQLPPPNQFAMDYLKNNFFSPSDIGFNDDPDKDSFAYNLLSGVDSGRLDKNQAFNQLGASGVNMQDPDLLNSKAYSDLLKDTITRPEARDIARGYGSILYGDEGISKDETNDIFKFAQSIGKTGSRQDFGNFAAAYMAQQPKGLRNRPLSSIGVNGRPSEQELATRYGSAVFDDKGSMFFKPSAGQMRRTDRVNTFQDALYNA